MNRQDSDKLTRVGLGAPMGEVRRRVLTSCALLNSDTWMSRPRINAIKTTPISAGKYSIRCLALSSIRFQSSRYRRSFPQGVRSCAGPVLVRDQRAHVFGARNEMRAYAGPRMRLLRRTSPSRHEVVPPCCVVDVPRRSDIHRASASGRIFFAKPLHSGKSAQL
jgi:hypothetical protein